MLKAKGCVLVVYTTKGYGSKKKNTRLTRLCLSPCQSRVTLQVNVNFTNLNLEN